MKKYYIKKSTLALLIWIFPSVVMGDAISHSPRLSRAIDYQIGGGYISGAPTPITTITILDIGVGWDLNMECGNFDPRVSVSQQLNGVTEGFQNMMGDIINNATGAVAGLPALAIQRANPGLYDMLQQGILQGKIDFAWAKTSCEEMQNVMMGDSSFPFEKYKLSIRTNNWAQQIDASGGDGIQAKNALDAQNHGNEGAEWICGTKFGGTGQQPIRALSDVVRVGYNILYDRANTCSTANVTVATGQNTPLWEAWIGPVIAANWAKRVLGDTQVRTCDGCTKMRGEAGKGLTFLHVEMTEDLINDLEDLVDGTTSISWQNLAAVSASPGVVVDETVIYAIQRRSGLARVKMISKLAGEIAFVKIAEQARLMTQILRTGVKEPNVAGFEPAKLIVRDAIIHLQEELGQIQGEMQIRRYVAQETILKIIGLEEQRVQNTREVRRSRPAGINVVGKPDS